MVWPLTSFDSCMPGLLSCNYFLAVCILSKNPIWSKPCTHADKPVLSFSTRNHRKSVTLTSRHLNQASLHGCRMHLPRCSAEQKNLWRINCWFFYYYFFFINAQHSLIHRLGLEVILLERATVSFTKKCRMRFKNVCCCFPLQIPQS